MIHDRIALLISKYTEHDMIQQHTGLPAFPELRIRLLTACLDGSGRPEPIRDLYASVVALIQIGLDTHDQIDTDASPPSERHMRSRQLNVLGGDYFSSRFYHLLSQAGEIDMIRQLSEAVCEVNRMKMDLYSRMLEKRLNADEYIEYRASIKAELFRGFASYLDESTSRLWGELLTGVTRCETLIEEWKRCVRSEAVHGSWAYWHIGQTGTEEDRRLLDGQDGVNGSSPSAASILEKYNVHQQLKDMLERQASQLTASIKRVEGTKRVDELNGIAAAFEHAMSEPALHSEMR
ncbi:heptaprenyl diphosphate synthase component 1 [Paenibacillus kobensis]|uniref:heptaprenyl diphosphate synthase component 1 n=1 Tax=Paenibacillus kobensis TaxID=59841 RepID=UPI000FD8D1CB|nr:heptaprenyl diphosphate synthase component 1 [Paenibacillus kobensis]